MNKALKQVLIVIVGLIALNIAGNQFYTFFDLTEDGRFTLAEPTRNVLEQVDTPVHIRVLLEGDFPAEIKRLQEGMQEQLSRFKSISKQITISYEDPEEGTVDARNQRFDSYKKLGINPSNLRESGKGSKSERFIFPAVIIESRDTLAMNLLDNAVPGVSEAEVINNSVNLLEYRLADGIKKAVFPSPSIVAFTTGRGELSPIQTYDLERNLRKNAYTVGRLNIDNVDIIDPQVDLLIIAKPQKTFSEKDKFILDQFVMGGGRVIWLIDRLGVELDSLRRQGSFVPRDYPLNLEDLLFKYGVRLQPNLLLDLENTKIPLQTGMLGDQPQYDAFDWFYYPLVRPFSDNPIVKNLDRVQLKFASTIDTIRTKTPIRKSILLRSSQYANMQFSPIDLNFEILRADPDPKQFNKPNQPVAVLLEGYFPSAYENRAKSEYLSLLKKYDLEFQAESVYNQMLVVSDGDVAANPIMKGEPKQLGRDEMSSYVYANKTFLLNAVEYMLDEAGLIAAKNRELKLRLLDKQRINQEKSFWQILNIALPLLFLLLFGLGYNFWRRRKYA